MPLLEHNSSIDVTGGIKLKLEACAKMSKFIENVWILDGRVPSRIIEAVTHENTIGTKIFNT